MKTVLSFGGWIAASVTLCLAQAVPPPPPPPLPLPPPGKTEFFIQNGNAARAVGVLSGQFSFEERVVKGHPYTADAVTETTQTLADGNHISRKETSSVARDSEGRTRREQTLNAVGPWATASASGARKIVFINDPVARVNYVLEPDMTARKLPEPPAGGAVFRMKIKDEAEAGQRNFLYRSTVTTAGTATVASPDSKTEQLGMQTIEGVEAQGTRTTTTIPAGAIGNELPIDIVSERWYSPELQTVVMTKSSDPRTGETVFRLTNVQKAEPPSSLFEVPSEYKIESGGYTLDVKGPDKN